MKKFLKLKILYKLIYIILIIIIIISFIDIINHLKIKQDISIERNLLNNINIKSNENIYNKIEVKNIDNLYNEKEIQETEKMLKVKNLKIKNKDIIGWIEIEGTNINYPVLQGDDNKYYLTHNYMKEKTKRGAIFLTAEYDWNIPSNNYIIYGHNLKSENVFNDLLYYEDEMFYIEHPVIKFTTEKNDLEFEIISVFKSRVFYKSEKNVFRYYNYVNINKEKYNEFIRNAKEYSLYKIDKIPKYGTQLLTLITCSYHTEDGRFVVIASEKDN